MKKISRLYVKVIFVFGIPFLLFNFLFINFTSRDPNGNTNRWRQSVILVKPKPGLPADKFNSILKQHNSAVISQLENIDVHLVQVPERAEENVRLALSKNPNIDFAELDKQLSLSEFIPNDPQFGQAWHLPKINAPLAWDNSEGAGIIIAVLDTGVDSTHPDLAPNMISGFNSVDLSSNTMDIKGHGTAVAGTAAAITNNQIGIAGVAGKALIMPIRVTNDPTGWAYWRDMARGLTWAADHGAKVVNMSYQTTGSSTVDSAALYFQNKGGVSVAAAGNDGLELTLSNDPYILTVSATDSFDLKASWSNFGNYIDVAAPGVSILTTQNGGGYANASGTSFASPAAAGVVALIMAANPNLGPQDVVQVLKNSADKVSGQNFDLNFGYGRVNAHAAVQLALTTPTSDSTPPSVLITSPMAGITSQGILSVSIKASDNAAIEKVSFYVGSKLIAEDNMIPYDFSLDTTNFLDGNYNLRAIAIDTSGNQSNPSTVDIIIKNNVIVDLQPPTVKIMNPSNGAKLSGNTIAVKVSAFDDDTIASIKVLIDGKQVAMSTSNSLSYSLNVKKLSFGTHTIQAIAEDKSGKTSSEIIQVSK